MLKESQKEPLNVTTKRESINSSLLPRISLITFLNVAPKWKCQTIWVFQLRRKGVAPESGKTLV